MANRYQTVLLLGGPGSGKGTQGETLGSILGFFHCSSGDIFRAIDPTTAVGKIFKDYSARGELVPDDVTIRLWAETVQSWVESCKYDPRHDLLILDGIPRTAQQAQFLDEHIDVLQVLHLVCRDREAMVERLRRRALKQGRKDDADETVIRNRWQVYDAATKPVIAHYPPEVVVDINAIATPLQVFADVLAAVKPIHEANMAPFGG